MFVIKCFFFDLGLIGLKKLSILITRIEEGNGLINLSSNKPQTKEKEREKREKRAKMAIDQVIIPNMLIYSKSQYTTIYS